VDLLFVPSYDWQAVKDIHAGMAAFRAVENGLSIYRQTGSGVSLMIDAYGRVVHRLDVFQEETAGDFAAVQVVTAPIDSVKTLYPITGDTVGTVMLLLSVLLLLGLLFTRKHSKVPVSAGSAAV
jgi:apolipoprotein N-acyltransferase